MNRKKRENKKICVWYIALGIGAVLVGFIGISLIVTERETLRVDAISGATLTSKSYLRAVEDAINKAQ